MNVLFVLIRRSFFLFSLIAICLVLIPSRTAAQNADLSVGKGGPATAAAGTDITYDIAVSNFSGQSSTPDNVLTDTLPAGLTFVSETHSPEWTCTTPAVGSGGTITCTNSNPIPDEYGATFTFVVHIASDVPINTVISNTASISHAGEDPGSLNNNSTWNTKIGEPPPPPPPPLNPHDVLISEFRLSGPNGDSDEYVELYCNRDVNCDISGASVRNYNVAVPFPNQPPAPGDLSYSFPSNTVIPARQYLLLGDQTQYSLSSYGSLDFNVHTVAVPDYFDDNEGFQFISAGEPTVIDSVGFSGGGDDFQFIEGTGLTRTTAARPGFQYAYVRKRTLATDGLPQDTDDNASDFVLVSVSGTPHPGIAAPPVLGAPGPQGLTSPLSYSNPQITASLVEPDGDKSASPNRVRTGSGNSGTISLRRSFTNNTNQTFDYIAFRVIEITTLNSPTIIGDQAQLRLISSENAESFTNSQGRPVNIQGTELEYDPGCGCEPAQPIGGGLNSTVSIVETSIAPGQTIDVQFLLDVDRAGQFRFFVYAEAFTTRAIQENLVKDAATKSGRLRVSITPHVPRHLINLKFLPKASAVKKPKSVGALPTKNFGGGTATPSTVAPVRVWIWNQPALSSNPTRKKKRIRRKASAALRAKAEARYRKDQPQN